MEPRPGVQADVWTWQSMSILMTVIRGIGELLNWAGGGRSMNGRTGMSAPPEGRDTARSGLREIGLAHENVGVRRLFGTSVATRKVERHLPGGVMQRPFQDRREAGRVLAGELRQYAGRPDVLILALPRGGVPVAHEVAQALDAPLDVFVVRKLGVPGHEELAMGAIATGGVRVLNEDVVRPLGIPAEVVDQVARREMQELARREALYRENRPPADVRGKTVILIDDGLATGSTMRAAAIALRQLGSKRLVVAVPTAAPETCDEFRREVDEVVCAITPQPFHAVGAWYEDFSQTTDEEVRELLAAANQRHPVSASAE